MTTRQIPPAPILSRILSAFVDYLVVTAAVLTLGRFSPVGGDYQFVFILLFGVIYFSLGNSRFLGGQTLGKRAFGLKTVSASADAGSAELATLPTCIARYLLLYGLPILIAEIPPMIFRAQGIIASPKILELNMLIALAYALSLTFQVFFSSSHRAIHELLTKTAVTSNSDEHAQMPSKISEHRLRKYHNLMILGSAVALPLWLLGVSHPEKVNEIHKHRYRIEKLFPIRIVSISQTEQSVDLQLLVFESSTQSFSSLAENIGNYLVSNSVIADDETNILDFSFYSLMKQSNSSESADTKNQFRYSPVTRSISSITSSLPGE